MRKTDIYHSIIGALQAVLIPTAQLGKICIALHRLIRGINEQKDKSGKCDTFCQLKADEGMHYAIQAYAQSNIRSSQSRNRYIRTH